MLNYIRAEIYKLLHRPYTYITLGVMLVLEGLLVAGHAFHNAHSLATPFGGAIVLITDMGIIGFCMCMITGDVVFAGQEKNATLKNEVSFGLSRTQIYMGKFLAQTLLSITYLVVMIGFYLGACAVILPIEPLPVEGFYSISSTNGLIIVGYFLAVGLPLWIGGQAVMCMCLFLVNGEQTSSFLYVGIMFVLEAVISIVSSFAGGRTGEILALIGSHMPRPMLEIAKSVVGDWAYMGKAWLVGAFWVAVCTAVGLYGFKKKEIK